MCSLLPLSFFIFDFFIYIYFFKDEFFGFLSNLFSTVSSAAPQIPLVPEDAGIEPRTVATLYFYYPAILLHQVYYHILILSSPNKIYTSFCCNVPLHFLLLLLSINLSIGLISPFLFIPGINSSLSSSFPFCFPKLTPFLLLPGSSDVLL